MNKLRYKIVPGKWRYELTSPYRFRIPEMEHDVKLWSGDFLVAEYKHDGIAIVYPGYRFDGVTAPWPFKGWLETEQTLAVALPHDIECQYQCVSAFRNHVISRPEADLRLLRGWTGTDRRDWAWIVYKAVRLAGILPPKQHLNLRVELIPAS
jgi:hypothetical protein